MKNRLHRLESRWRRFLSDCVGHGFYERPHMGRGLPSVLADQPHDGRAHDARTMEARSVVISLRVPVTPRLETR